MGGEWETPDDDFLNCFFWRESLFAFGTTTGTSGQTLYSKYKQQSVLVSSNDVEVASLLPGNVDDTKTKKDDGKDRYCRRR